MLRISNSVPEWARNALMVLFLIWMGYVGMVVWQLKQFSSLVTISQQDRVIEERVHLLVTRAESAQRGYLITGSEDYKLDYYSSREQLHANFRTLKVYLRNNKDQYATLMQLEKLIATKFDEMDYTIALYAANGRVPDSALPNIHKGLVTMHTIEDLLAVLTAEESDHLRHLRSKD